jgi:hypothetical protein
MLGILIATGVFASGAFLAHRFGADSRVDDGRRNW